MNSSVRVFRRLFLYPARHLPNLPALLGAASGRESCSLAFAKWQGGPVLACGAITYKSPSSSKTLYNEELCTSLLISLTSQTHSS